MTRPKVDPDKRQRTACACDSCKRRKQKCNGHSPCNTCLKRHLTCAYTPTPVSPDEAQSPVASPTKRRHVDTSPTASNVEGSMVRPRQASVHISSLAMWDTSEIPAMKLSGPNPNPSRNTKVKGVLNRNSLNDFLEVDSHSRGTNSTHGDEAEVYPSQRLLQDSTGRLLYVGDSATLSYLQLIRMLVESIAGQSDFTMDPKRHMIMEAKIGAPPIHMPSGILPDRMTADVLIRSFFINTTGLIEVFDKRTFLEQFSQCYHDPLTVDPAVLCLINLVFSIGLVLSSPLHGTEDDAVVKKLRDNKDFNRAEVFFRNAKSLADPVSGFEDADFWSVQALLLMSTYMLAVSKRNAAYAYHGMAVRSAFALGLHQKEDPVIFNAIQIKVRRNLWRSLYILDRFLSASLGRPAAISDDDCSENALASPQTTFDSESDRVSSAALDASVRTCRVIGDTLKKVYSKRKISIKVAQSIAEEFQDWDEQLYTTLQWQRAPPSQITPGHGIAILHVNLLHYHSIILLARPFFLYILKAGFTHKSLRLNHRMEDFAKICVEAAQHTLSIAQTALETNCLSQCNPFVIYFVFAAGLIVLSNEFASLYHNPDAEKATASCIAILKYCAQRDAQAQRVIYIVEKFHEVNRHRPTSAMSVPFADRKAPIIAPASNNPHHDAMVHFFANTRHSPQQQVQPLAPSPKHDRSDPSAGHPGPMSHPIPSVLQQPSPDASGTSPVDAIPAGLPVLESMHGSDAEFGFDELWPNATWQPPGAMPLPQSIDATEGYGHYTIGPPSQAMDIGNVLGANGNIAMYHVDNFCPS